jgi:hypothetical protein
MPVRNTLCVPDRHDFLSAIEVPLGWKGVRSGRASRDELRTKLGLPFLRTPGEKNGHWPRAFSHTAVS